MGKEGLFFYFMLLGKKEAREAKTKRDVNDGIHALRRNNVYYLFPIDAIESYPAHDPADFSYLDSSRRPQTPP